MCFFLRTSFLLRIAGGGAAPSPLHPPTRFYFLTGAPWYLILFRLLFPSASKMFFSYVLLSSYFFLGIYFTTGPPWYLLLFRLLLPSASTIWVPMCFFLCTSFLVRIAGGGAAPSPLHPPTRFYCVTGAPCSRLFFRLLFPSAPPLARVYVLPGAPGYLLLFVLLFPSASRICFPMCFFLRTSFLLRIAGGGAAPSPLHPPTRFYCVTGAPWYLLLFRLLFPSASTIFFSHVLLSSYILLSWYIFHNRPPLVPTPIPFAFAISINDLGSYVLLGTHPPTCFDCVTGAPCSRLFFRLLFPSAPPPPAFMFYPAPLATYSYSFCFFHQLQGFAFLCASFFVLLSCYALRGEALRPPPCTPPPLLLCNLCPLVPTPLPFAFSISINRFFPMCFFLRTSCLVYISQPAPLGT